MQPQDIGGVAAAVDAPPAVLKDFLDVRPFHRHQRRPHFGLDVWRFQASLEQRQRVAPSLGEGFRVILDRLVRAAERRFPELAGQAREVRYQFFVEMPAARPLYWNKSRLPPGVVATQDAQKDGRTLYRFSAKSLPREWKSTPETA